MNIDKTPHEEIRAPMDVKIWKVPDIGGIACPSMIEVIGSKKFLSSLFARGSRVFASL